MGSERTPEYRSGSKFGPSRDETGGIGTSNRDGRSAPVSGEPRDPGGAGGWVVEMKAMVTRRVRMTDAEMDDWAEKRLSDEQVENVLWSDRGWEHERDAWLDCDFWREGDREDA